MRGRTGWSLWNRIKCPSERLRVNASQDKGQRENAREALAYATTRRVSRGSRGRFDRGRTPPGVAFQRFSLNLPD